MKPPAWIRQHPWAFGAALALALSAAAEGALVWRLENVRAEAARHRGRLQTMKAIADKYRALKTRPVSAPLLAGGVRLSPAVVNRMAKERGIAGNISASDASPVRVDAQTQEQLVGLTLTAVAREDLARFLQTVEQLDPAIQTKELRLSVNTKQPSLVDARVQISAHEAIATTSK